MTPAIANPIIFPAEPGLMVATVRRPAPLFAKTNAAALNASATHTNSVFAMSVKSALEKVVSVVITAQRSAATTLRLAKPILILHAALSHTAWPTS